MTDSTRTIALSAAGFGLALSIACSHAPTAPAACNYPDGLTITVSRTISVSCTVTGDLVVGSHARLLIDYTRAPGASFSVAGNVIVHDSANLSARASNSAAAFIVANQYTSEFAIMLSGHAALELDQIELRTRATGSAADGSRSMGLTASDDAIMSVNAASLDPTTSWLLGDFHGRSQLQALNTSGIPTEIYVHDSTSITISGANTGTGLWFESPPSGTIDLPMQGAPYSWQMGRAEGFAVGWEFAITNANVGIGMQSLPGSRVNVNGHGGPATGEFKVGYFVANGIDTLRDLTTGLQNSMIGDGRITFSNVNLGPIAWQIYAGGTETLRIDSSTVNEIGLFGPASVTVNHSLLQLAVLGAIAPGSSLEVDSSVVWNQLIEAGEGATIRLNDSQIIGSLFDALGASSQIVIAGGAFASNPTGCTLSTAIDVSTGQPLCDPFRPPGPPTRTGPGTVTCTGTAGCSF